MRQPHTAEMQDTTIPLNNNFENWAEMKKGSLPCSCHGNDSDKTNEEHKVVISDTVQVVSRPFKVKRAQAPSTDTLSSPPPGQWPLKRSQSVDSRDNPFLPGGELQKEADEILARAKIVRDKFILNVNDHERSQMSQGSPTHGDQAEETISPEVANKAEMSPQQSKPRENGKLDESASPESVKLDIPNDQIDGNVISDDTNRDKKKQKKCCSIM